MIPGALGTVRGAAWASILVLLAALAACSSTTTTTTRPSSNPGSANTPEDGDVRRRARIRLELAVGYFEQGKIDIALEELRQALAFDSQMPEAYNLRGLIQMRLNDPGAEESFRRAMALNPADGSAVHNLGWMQCQRRRFDEARRTFAQALAMPSYGDRARTLLAQGICDIRAGEIGSAEQALLRAYELDAGNPVVGYNLALLQYQRGDLNRAQFYVRRINAGEFANAETLWLGVRIERRLGNPEAMNQLGDQLRRRFPNARETALLERGAFND